MFVMDGAGSIRKETSLVFLERAVEVSCFLKLKHDASGL